MKRIKIGDRFKLGPWEWRVTHIGALQKDSSYLSISGLTAETESYCQSLTVPMTEVEKLQWLASEPKISKEAAEEIKGRLISPHDPCSVKEWFPDFIKFIDSMIEDEE